MKYERRYDFFKVVSTNYSRDKVDISIFFSAITCPKLRIPENGYLVKASACSNVMHAACGIRCRIGFHLTGDSIRLCGKNGNWSGNEPQCLRK